MQPPDAALRKGEETKPKRMGVLGAGDKKDVRPVRPQLKKKILAAYGGV